jgi:antitoxin (DNA-binding transcriptional repressor) of toxin-antitoxin stability system
VETVSIRNLRGDTLRDHAGEGKLLAITDRGALVGVAVPVAPAWLEHLIDYNLSHVHESIAEAEQAIAAGTPMVTLQDVIGRLQETLNPPRSGTAQETGSPRPSPVTKRIGDLSAAVIKEAGDNGQTIAVTHERVPIAIIIPVTRDLVEFLLEQNMSRVLNSIDIAEKEIRNTDAMIRLGHSADGPAGAEGI